MDNKYEIYEIELGVEDLSKPDDEEYHHILLYLAAKDVDTACELAFDHTEQALGENDTP